MCAPYRVDLASRPRLWHRERSALLYGNSRRGRRYGDEYELDPGIEFDEVVTFVVPHGTYHVGGVIGQGNETIGDEAVIRIE